MLGSRTMRSAHPTRRAIPALLCVLLLGLVDAWPHRGGYRKVVAVGVLAGALAWVKPVFLPLPAFLFLGEWWRGRGAVTALVRSAVVAARTRFT